MNAIKFTFSWVYSLSDLIKRGVRLLNFDFDKAIWDPLNDFKLFFPLWHTRLESSAVFAQLHYDFLFFGEISLSNDSQTLSSPRKLLENLLINADDAENILGELGAGGGNFSRCNNDSSMPRTTNRIFLKSLWLSFTVRPLTTRIHYFACQSVTRRRFSSIHELPQKFFPLCHKSFPISCLFYQIFFLNSPRVFKKHFHP